MDEVFFMPIASVSETRKEGRFLVEPFWDEEPSSGIDAKVQGIVKRKIASSLGSLFVSLSAPFLPEFRSSVRNIFRSKRRFSSRPETFSIQEELIPLGLIACGTSRWINALMQIALRLPIFRTILLLWAPESYEPFQRFIDQYDADQKAKLEISLASSMELIHCLMKKMPSESIQSNSPDFFEIFRILLISGSPKRSIFLKVHSKPESCCLIEWDVDVCPFFDLIDEKLKAHAPGHLLVFVKNREESSFVIPKQIVDGKGQYYDLHGFIERRPDAVRAEFIAYVKALGKTWYQCRDEGISKLHSIHLHVPLMSGDFFYYRKCS